MNYLRTCFNGPECECKQKQDLKETLFLVSQLTEISLLCVSTTGTLWYIVCDNKTLRYNIKSKIKI